MFFLTVAGKINPTATAELLRKSNCISDVILLYDEI